MPRVTDFFGEFLMNHFRDGVLECVNGLCDGKFDSPGHRQFQNELEGFTEDQKDLLKRTVAYCMDGGMNNLLFDLDSELRKGKRIQILVDGQQISDDSEALHRELWGPSGWIAKFSKYGPYWMKSRSQ